VLTGVVAAMLARCDDPFAATCAAVHAHSRAGRGAAERVGSAESVIAGDVIEALPEGLDGGRA
jgi:NAD(P)H-hydrate repair Nnr-like enzyme with NAD(P)H-hydrate dehydratase domain